MFSCITEANAVVVNTDWVVVVELIVTVVPAVVTLGDLQQFGLVVTEGDSVLSAVVLGEEEDITEVCKLVCCQNGIICKANGRNHLMFAVELPKSIP